VTNKLTTFEEHGEALAYQVEKGWRGETVLCFDRHLDIAVIPPARVARAKEALEQGASLLAQHRDLPFRDDEQYTHGLDDFVYLAAALGTVSRFVWVPPPTPDPEATLWEELSWLPGHGEEVARSWRPTRCGAYTRVGGLQIEVATLDTLQALSLPADVHVDIDLDWFCDERGRGESSVAELNDVLDACGLGENVETLCYSNVSGFLPWSHRYLAEHLAASLGGSLEQDGRPPPLRLQTMDHLTGRAPAHPSSLEKLIDEELAPLGGPGWSLAAVLAARLQELERAEECWQQARDAGDRARWPAYAAACALVQRGAYKEALSWVDRVDGPPDAALWVQSQQLGAVAALRLNADRRAARYASACSERVPFRPEPAKLAAIAYHRLGEERAAARWHARAERATLGPRGGR